MAYATAHFLVQSKVVKRILQQTRYKLLDNLHAPCSEKACRSEESILRVSDGGQETPIDASLGHGRTSRFG